MKTKLLFKIEKAIFGFIGDIKWSGILRPFWFTINGTSFLMKGKNYRQLNTLIQPGDIIVRRFEGYVDKWLIPGWWNHAGIYVGKFEDHDHIIVHAISDGVVIDDLIDFMRTDHMIVLRAPKKYITTAIDKAIKAVGSEYDFAFDFKDTVRFSCTELIGHCYQGIINSKKRFGRTTIVADDIVQSNKLDVVWDSRRGA